MSSKPATVDVSLGLLAIMAVGAVWAVGLFLGGDRVPALALAPGAVLAAAAGALLLLVAASGSRRGLAAMLIIVTVVLSISFRTRDYGNTGIDLQNGAKILVWLLIPLIALINHQRLTVFLRDPSILMVAGFAAVAFLSTLWSATPFYTGGAAVGLWSYLFLACLVVVALKERELLTVLLWSVAALGVLAVISAVLLPGNAWFVPVGSLADERLQGLSGHPNVLGEQMAVLITLSVIARRKGLINRGLFIAFLVLGFGVLEASGSRTMLAAVILAWAVVALRQRRLLGAAAAAITIVIFAFVLALAVGINPIPQSVLASLSRSGDTSEIVTLTGRTELWQVAWELIRAKPILGWGFNGTEALFVANVGRAFYGDPVNAHNMYLQTLATLGLVGSLPFFGLFFLAFKRMVTDPDPARDHFVLLVAIIGLAEVAIAGIPNVLSLVFLIFVARDACRILPTSQSSVQRPRDGSVSLEAAR